jgi:hypothetical protein
VRAVASVSASASVLAQGSLSELVMDPESESALASVRAWASALESGSALVEAPSDPEWERAMAWDPALAWPEASTLSGQVLAWMSGSETDCRSASGRDRE